MQYDNLARDGETRSRVRKQTSCRVSMTRMCLRWRNESVGRNDIYVQ